jgi:hypothetical protein
MKTRTSPNRLSVAPRKSSVRVQGGTDKLKLFVRGMRVRIVKYSGAWTRSNRLSVPPELWLLCGQAASKDDTKDKTSGGNKEENGKGVSVALG